MSACALFGLIKHNIPENMVTREDILSPLKALTQKDVPGALTGVFGLKSFRIVKNLLYIGGFLQPFDSKYMLCRFDITRPKDPEYLSVDQFKKAKIVNLLALRQQKEQIRLINAEWNKLLPESKREAPEDTFPRVGTEQYHLIANLRTALFPKAKIIIFPATIDATEVAFAAYFGDEPPIEIALFD